MMTQLDMFATPITQKQSSTKLKNLADCKVIYEPKGRAGEYHRLACNLYRGCGHKCTYCYVPAAIFMPREKFDAGALPRNNALRELEADAKVYQAHGITETVMMSFTTDPYNPDDVQQQLTRQGIKILQAHGLGVCALTKGGYRALRDIDLFRVGRDQFATTLTSIDDAVSLEWEGGAALPKERMATLKQFHDAGIYTWVSLEPVYDVEATLEIIRLTHSYVDLFKVGKINYHRVGKTIDWYDFTARAVDLLNEVGANYYLKEDLKPFMR